MIRSIEIRGFKRFTGQTFSLSPLTVLTGLNGAGKTSVIHALLLVREAARRKDGIVELSGPFGLELGTFEDVLNKETLGTFGIRLISDQAEDQTWTFSEGSTQLYANVRPPPEEFRSPFSAESRSFQYLSAERLGPRITLGSAALPPELLEVGPRGEYSAQVLDTLGTTTVEEPRWCPADGEDDLPLLKPQTERWLSRVTRPVQIDTEAFIGTSLTALKFRTGEDWIKPTNMGFGITYALPVVLAGLSGCKEGLLVVENPEAHLHPSGQSQMGIFLARMAAAGLQVIVETHSDHVLNGIRRAVGEQKVLLHTDVVVHYFDVETPEPQALSISPNGAISSWPRGFFDQFQIDVAALTKIRRPR